MGRIANSTTTWYGVDGEAVVGTAVTCRLEVVSNFKEADNGLFFLRVRPQKVDV